MRRTVLRRVEALEPRLAMAGIFTYVDVDGDVVTVQTDLGTDTALASALTLVPAGGAGGSQLTRVDLNAPEFAGTSLRIKAEAGLGGGDGQVNVGQIMTPHDLGWVTVGGDLGRIRAGDANLTTPGVDVLSTLSIGYWGTVTGSSDTVSMIQGPLSSLRVFHDLWGARFIVGGRAAEVEIGGTVFGRDRSDGFEADSIGIIRVGGSVHGNSTDDSGRILSQGMIDELVVGGSLEGGYGQSSGIVRASGIGTARIGRSLVGGDGQASGGLYAVGPEGITVVQVGTTLDDGLRGGRGDRSGSIWSDGAIGSIVVSGSVTGGQGDRAGHIAAQRIGSIDVGGDLAGGVGNASGSVGTVGRLGALRVRSIFSGDGPLSGSVSGRLLGDIVVRQDIRGTAQQPVCITGVGSLSSSGARAIDSLTVGGGVWRTLVLGGWYGSVPQNGAARIGAVTVNGSMRTSSVVAGVQTHRFPLFGFYPDEPIGGVRGSRIESFVVHGTVRGNALRDRESFAVIADSIDTVRIGSQSYVATQTGVRPAGDNFLIRLTNTGAGLPPLPGRFFR